MLFLFLIYCWLEYFVKILELRNSIYVYNVLNIDFNIYIVLFYYSRKLLVLRVLVKNFDWVIYSFYNKIFRDISDFLNFMRNVFE